MSHRHKSLRSSNRIKRMNQLTVQQNETVFRSSLCDCNRTRIEDFQQREFLSLFRLVPVAETTDTKIKFIDSIDYRDCVRKKSNKKEKATNIRTTGNDVSMHSVQSEHLRIVLGKLVVLYRLKGIIHKCLRYQFRNTKEQTFSNYL